MWAASAAATLDCGGREGPSLLGKDWLARLKLNWTRILKMGARDRLHKVLERHAPVFALGLGKVRGVEVKLQADP